jgi:chromate transporter
MHGAGRRRGSRRRIPNPKPELAAPRSFRQSSVLVALRLHQLRRSCKVIAIMHRELVERFLDLRAALPARAQLLHGAVRAEAQQLATYIGWLMHGTRGGIVAGGLFGSCRRSSS